MIWSLNDSIKKWTILAVLFQELEEGCISDFTNLTISYSHSRKYTDWIKVKRRASTKYKVGDTYMFSTALRNTDSNHVITG